jgi:flagellar basal body rod protein FlgB
MQNAKTTCDELKAFYNSRAALEDEYSRKLLALCRKPLGSGETGSLRTSLDVLRGEVESMGKQHALIASQMKSELEEPLAAFAGGMKERRKIVQTGIERLLKTKQAQTAHVNKSRDKYEQDCLRIKGYLAQGHMVMGQEERKNKAKLEKTQINMASNSNEYEAALKVLEETIGRWNKEWKAACDVSEHNDTLAATSNGSTEIPRSRRRAHRLHESFLMVFRQHRFHRVRNR